MGAWLSRVARKIASLFRRPPPPENSAKGFEEFFGKDERDR
jgi:hypothetical protein